MRWSYPDFLLTPEPVIDEVASWMRDLEREEQERQRQAKRDAERSKRRR